MQKQNPWHCCVLESHINCSYVVLCVSWWCEGLWVYSCVSSSWWLTYLGEFKVFVSNVTWKLLWNKHTRMNYSVMCVCCMQHKFIHCACCMIYSDKWPRWRRPPAACAAPCEQSTVWTDSVKQRMRRDYILPNSSQIILSYKLNVGQTNRASSILNTYL